MAACKTPILLRRTPLTGGVSALTRYKWVARNGDPRAVLQVVGDGRQDVTADFDALVIEHLLDPDARSVVEQLDGAARGMVLCEPERAEVAAFRARLIELIVRHNTTGHGAVVE